MKWMISLVLALFYMLQGINSLEQSAFAQQTDDSAEQEATEEVPDSVDSVDENFVPSETINVDTEISFPVDI